MQNTASFFTTAETAAVAGFKASTLRALVHRGTIAPKQPARWTTTEVLAVAIFAELVAEQIEYSEAAGMAGAILELVLRNAPKGRHSAEAVFVIETVDAAGQRALRACYSKADADRVVNILLKQNPVSIRLRDFSDTFQRVRQAREAGVVDVAGIAAMNDPGAGHA